MGLVNDFREFVGSGNAIDLAVGVIIGSAMTMILTSFVNELIVPLTGLIGKVDLANNYIVIKGAEKIKEGMPLAEVRKLEGVVALGWGSFLTVLINTLILAFVVFMVVRSINKMRKAQATEPPAPPADVMLLTEIRDLLKTR
jgi:large conductance mechanosensitive channel